jgi:hypothetical protein
LEKCGGLASLIDVGELSARDLRGLSQTPIRRDGERRRSWAEVCECVDRIMVRLPISEDRVVHDRVRVSFKGVVRRVDARRKHFVAQLKDGKSFSRTRAELLETVLVEGEPGARLKLNRVLGSRCMHPADKVAW